MERIYITVVARVAPDGDLFPQLIRFDDGAEFSVDQRLEPPKRNRAKNGSEDWRFPCLIAGRPVTLFFDASSYRWWVGRGA